MTVALLIVTASLAGSCLAIAVAATVSRVVSRPYGSASRPGHSPHHPPAGSVPAADATARVALRLSRGGLVWLNRQTGGLS